MSHRDREAGPPPATEAEEPEASQSVTVDGVTYDLGSIGGQKAMKRDGVRPERHRQMAEAAARKDATFEVDRWNGLKSGEIQARRSRGIGYVSGVGFTHQVQRHGGPWSELEVIRPEVIEAERQRNPRWHATERRARAALRGLRRAERLLRGLRVVPSPRARGRNEHRPGHRRATASRGPPNDGDDDPEPALGGPLARCRRGREYTFQAHHWRFGHLAPADRLAAFLALAEWQRRQAWRSLRFDIDRERAA